MASSLRGPIALLLLIAAARPAVAQAPRLVDLPAAWREARRRSPRLPAAAAAIERAEAAARLARSAWMPSLRGQASYTRIDGERALGDRVLVPEDAATAALVLNAPLVDAARWRRQRARPRRRDQRAPAGGRRRAPPGPAPGRELPGGAAAAARAGGDRARGRDLPHPAGHRPPAPRRAAWARGWKRCAPSASCATTRGAAPWPGRRCWRRRRLLGAVAGAGRAAGRGRDRRSCPPCPGWRRRWPS